MMTMRPEVPMTYQIRASATWPSPTCQSKLTTAHWSGEGKGDRLLLNWFIQPLFPLPLTVSANNWEPKILMIKMVIIKSSTSKALRGCADCQTWRVKYRGSQIEGRCHPKWIGCSPYWIKTRSRGNPRRMPKRKRVISTPGTQNINRAKSQPKSNVLWLENKRRQGKASRKSILSKVSLINPIYLDVELKKMDPRSLYLFDQTSPFRILSYRIIKSKYFNALILLCLILNCIALALYDYEEKYRLRNDITQGIFKIDLINIVFTCVFFVEMLFHSVYRGFIIFQNSYLRNPSIMIDVIIIITG
jgi:hypothetical protein